MPSAIESLRTKYAEKRARLDVLADPTDDQGGSRPATEAENTEFDSLEVECRGLLGKINKLESLSLEPAQTATEGPDRRSAPPKAPAVHTRNHSYSFCNAIANAMSGKPLAGIEAEVNEEIARRNNRRAKGFYVPIGASAEIRKLMNGGKEVRSLDTNAGSGLIFNSPETPLIEYLRPKLVTRKIGARFMEDVQGTFSIPRQTATSQPQSMVSGVNVTSTNASYDQVHFSPKLVMALTSIDPNLAYQSSFSAEDLIKSDLSDSMAQFIDYLAFNGPGGVSPTGVFVNSQVQANGKVVLGTNGGNPNYANMIAMETALSLHNADRNKLAYVATSNVRGYLKDVPKNGPGYPNPFVWENPVKAGADGVINGYDAYCTNILLNNITKGTGTNLSQICFADWSQLCVALWEGADLLVDPYTGREQGITKVSLMLGVDVQLRHPEAFSIISDAQT